MFTTQIQQLNEQIDILVATPGQLRHLIGIQILFNVLTCPLFLFFELAYELLSSLLLYLFNSS